MKLSCPREVLLSACQLAGAAVPSRDLNPTLRNIRLTAEPGRCTLDATDQELSVSLAVSDVAVDDPGVCLLPAQRMASILRESRDDTVTLAVTTDGTGKENGIVVTIGAAEFELPCEDPAHYPDVPTFPEGDHHAVSAAVLRGLIRRTTFAADKKEGARPAMTGVLLEFDAGVVRLVATDGRRMAVTEGPGVPVGSPGRGSSPVVPVKALDLLERLIAGPEEAVKVVVRPNEVLFGVERATVTTRLIDGRYPGWRDVFPKKECQRIPVPVGPFKGAVRQAAIMVDEEGNRVAFAFTPSLLTLTAQGKDVGRSKVTLPVEFDGTAVSACLNPRYVLDMLKGLDDAEEVVVGMIDAASVVQFGAGAETRYVVMPLN